MQLRLKKIATITIVVLVIILLIGFGSKAYDTYAVKRAATSFINNALNGDAAATYQQYSATAQQNEDEKTWELQVNQLKEVFKGNTASYVSTSEVDDYNLLDYTINGSDGHYLFEVTIVKAGLGHKVQAFTSSLQ